MNWYSTLFQIKRCPHHHKHDDDDEEWEQILLARNHFSRMSLPHQWARVRLRGVSRTKSTSSAGHNCAAHYPLLDTGSAMLSRMHCIAGCSLQTYSPVHYTHHANTPDNISLCWIALHIISCTLSAAHSFQLTFHCLGSHCSEGGRRETHITALGNINYWILPFDNRIIVMIDEEEKRYGKVGLEKGGPFN